MSHRDEDPAITSFRKAGVPVFSPSQISTWRECQRKWAFRYVEGVKTPSHPSAEIGTEMHDQLEKYLRDGTPLDFTKRSGDVAASGLHLIPAPQSPGLRIEGGFYFQSPDTGFVYHGYRDWLVEPHATPDGLPEVGDHKSCGNWAYAKTADGLREDPQATIYAYDAMARFKTPTVRLKWVYYGTKKPHKARPVELTATSREMAPRFREIEADARLMAASLLVRKPALEHKPNPEACHNYGGCPHRMTCQLSPEQGIQSMFDHSKIAEAFAAPLQISADEALAALMAGGSTPAPATPPPPAAPAAPLPPAELPAWLTAATDPGPGASMRDPATFTQPVQTPPAPASSPFPPTDQPINPPEFQSQLSKEQREALEAESRAKTEANPAPEGEKPKRTRRTKAEMAAARAAENQGQVTPVIAAEDVGFTLYVNCRPDRVVTDVAHLIARAQERIRTEHPDKPADYRYISFGNGVGLLSGIVKDLADKANADLFVDTRTPEGAHCLAALVAIAGEVVRGL